MPIARAWLEAHAAGVDFWRLMLAGCWLVYPCLAVPDWVWG